MSNRNLNVLVSGSEEFVGLNYDFESNQQTDGHKNQWTMHVKWNDNDPQHNSNKL